MSALLLAAVIATPFKVPPPGVNTASGGAVRGALASCTGDAVSYDNNGVAGCQRTTDTAPQGLLLRSQVAYPAGTQTASDIILAPGQDETLTAIDGADPSVSCAGENDTVTVTVINSNGTATATILTEDQTYDAATDWTASASVADTCASLATAVDALAGVAASCTSPNVLITLDPSTARVTLAESTAGCTTVGTGTTGVVQLLGAALHFESSSSNTYIQSTGADVMTHVAGGSTRMSVRAGDVLLSSTIDLQLAGTDGTSRIQNSSAAPLYLGSTTATSSYSLGQTAVLASGALEVDGAAYLDGPIVSKRATIAADDATPSISGGSVFTTSANTGATAITDLDDPIAAQTVTLCGGSDTNSSTIADSGNFNLSAAMTLSLDDCITLHVQADNDYVEVGRVNN